MVAGLEVRTYVLDDAVVVAPVGEVDMATVPALSEALTAALQLQAGVGLVCCDLAGVTFLDSSGLGALVKASKQAKAHGLAFCLSGATGPVVRVLRVTAMDRVFVLYDSVQAACAAQAGSSPNWLQQGR